MLWAMGRPVAILLAASLACVESQGAESHESDAAETGPALPSASADPRREPVAAAITLTFVGDVMEGRYRDWGHDPIAPPEFSTFGHVRDLLDADVVVANLETPIVPVLPIRSPVETRSRFGAAAPFAKTLREAGVTVVSLANNHWYDLAEEGQLRTPAILVAEGILPVGASLATGSPFRVETLERSGLRIGFIAVTTRRNGPARPGPLIAPYRPIEQLVATVAPLLRDARATHDLLVVLVHWGRQYHDEPEDAQVAAGHALVDAGADLVVGHHPHVIQAIERYGSGLVAYSLGNFLMEHTGEVPRLSGVLRLSYGGRPACLVAGRFHPVLIRRTPYQHPVPASGHLASGVRRRLHALSATLGTRWVGDDGTEDLILDDLPSCP